MQDEEKFSDNPEENLRIENELLRIKLKAQYGDAFQMGTSEDMPPEIENQFLKNVLAFEESYEQREETTVYDRIGRPAYKPAEQLTKEEMKIASEKFMQLFADNGIDLGFCDGPYDDEVVYRFITEEFFEKGISKTAVPGMISGFIYEEYHPNHRAEIEKRTHQFLKEWFTRSFDEDYCSLAMDIVTADGKQMKRKEGIKKMKLFFDAFKSFDNDGYNIVNISFELQPEEQRGFGFSEGMLKYDAMIDNGETIHFEGPYKIYMGMEYNWWNVFYFVMPGFKW